MTEPSTSRVTVADFDMPFLSMVRFMIKWAIAAIPAIFIIMLAAALFWGIVFGTVATLSTAWVSKAATPPTSASSPGTVDHPEGQAEDSAAKEYLGRVVVSNVHVARGVLDQLGVFGEVKNTGDRTLKEVEITIYCLGADGKPIFETKYHPVLVTDLSFGDNNNPLKPGYSRTFGVKMDDAPSAWTKKVDVQVTSVSFQEGSS